jgi:hypothetical protein
MRREACPGAEPRRVEDPLGSRAHPPERAPPFARSGRGDRPRPATRVRSRSRARALARPVVKRTRPGPASILLAAPERGERTLTREGLQIASLSAAFWVAAVAYRRREPGGAAALRFVAGLAAGAALAHLGWLALYAGRLRGGALAWLLEPGGFTVLFAPLGLLSVAPWRQAAEVRTRFLAAALRALVPALAVARLGCLAAGCCRGIPTSLPWGLRPPGGTVPCHPTPLYDIAGLLLLGAVLARLPERRVPAAFAAGFGALRLALEPFRATPPLGAPALPVAVLAGAWVTLGVGLAWASLGAPPARPQGGGRPGEPDEPSVLA